MTAKICRQNYVSAPDRIGGLAELTARVKQAGINIQAICVWTMDGTGHLMMATDDPDKACGVLREKVTECQFQEVVCLTLPNIPGALQEVADKIAKAGIAIELLYGTACDCQGCDCDTATLVMATTNNAKVLELLKQ